MKHAGPSANGSTTLTMRMDTKSRRLLPKLMMPLVCLFIRKAVEKDMDVVREFCERRDNTSR